MADNALSPFGFNLESVLEAKRRQQADLAAMYARNTGFAGLGAGIGTIFGRIAAHGKVAPEIELAKRGEAVTRGYSESVSAALDAGADPYTAQLDALRGASKAFRDNGMVDQAAAVDYQALQLRLQQEAREQERTKLLADLGLIDAKTDQANAAADKSRADTANVGKGTPGEYERLTAQLENPNLSDASKALIRKRLEKLAVITGRTDVDAVAGGIAMTKPTLTKVQEDIKDGQKSIDYLSNVATNYDPALDLGLYANKAKYEALTVAAKANAASPEQGQWLAAANAQQQRIQTGYNAEVKLLSGSAVSAHEQKRVDKQEIVEADPPQIKQAKMAAILAYKKAEQARRLHAAEQGDAAVLARPITDFMDGAGKAAWAWEAPGKAAVTGPAADMTPEQRKAEAARLLGL